MKLQAIYRKLAQYKSLKNDLNSILYYLKNTINPLKSAGDAIKLSYLFDSIAADNGGILLEHDRIKSVINSLEYTILPSINSEIKNLNTTISDAEVAQLLI